LQYWYCAVKILCVLINQLSGKLSDAVNCKKEPEIGIDNFPINKDMGQGVSFLNVVYGNFSLKKGVISKGIVVYFCAM
jgi:hypothetical protein